MSFEIRDDKTGEIIPPDTVYYVVRWEVNGTWGKADYTDFDDVLNKCRQVQQMVFAGNPRRTIEVRWDKSQPLPS